MIDSLCILGGGTSGIVSALMLNKAWPELKITLIESSQIGIIGVGEGSTEHWSKFMKQAEISVFELIEHCGTTYKMGIKFTNWHGDGTHYFHSLSEQYGPHSPFNGIPYVLDKMISNNIDPLNTVWELSQQSRHVEPLHDIFAQYHFDTNKLNSFFHRKCTERGITIIDKEIADVVLDDSGYVKHLVDKDSNIHAFDFFIDCSGFKRVIGSKLGVKWIDCSEELPMNSALAFPTAYKEDIPSYTEATALSSGWVWRIPTQDRFGNGYVFCDQFINETEAYDEVSQHYRENLGITEELQIGKRVKFSAGYVDKFWIKNCAMVGLSSMFVEPLEASSIGTTIQQTFTLLPSLYHYERGEDKTPAIYNTMITDIAKNIVDFIQLHYFTERNDTAFWQWCKTNIKLTEFNRDYLDYFKKQGVNPQYFNTPLILFGHMNYIQIMHALRMFNTDIQKDRYQKHMSKKYDPIVQSILDEDRRYMTDVPSWSHREAIEIIKERGRSNEIKYKF